MWWCDGIWWRLCGTERRWLSECRRYYVRWWLLKWMLLTVVFIGKGKMQWGKVKSSTHIQHRWQNILTKLPGLIGQTRNASTPFETWNCPVQMKLKITFFQHTNRYIFIIQPTFSHESDAKLTDEIWDESFHRSSVLSWSTLEWKAESGRMVGYWLRWHQKISFIDESETLQDPNQMHSWLNLSCIHKILYLLLADPRMYLRVMWDQLHSYQGHNQQSVKKSNILSA